VARCIERVGVQIKEHTALPGDMLKYQEPMVELGAGALEPGQGGEILTVRQPCAMVAVELKGSHDSGRQHRVEHIRRQVQTPAELDCIPAADVCAMD
jgi:hypothetical protein